MMVLYGITLVPLVEELRDVDTTLLSPFYACFLAFDESVQSSASQLHLLMDRKTNWGYFLDMAKLLFIANNPEKKEAVRK